MSCISMQREVEEQERKEMTYSNVEEIDSAWRSTRMQTSPAELDLPHDTIMCSQLLYSSFAGRLSEEKTGWYSNIP